MELKIKYIFLPKNSNDKKNVILEIRAGTGGDEASLFAGKLFSMYSKFAEKKNWKFEVLTFANGTKGGFKDVSINVKGKNVYQWLKYESGVHRVQRVPRTESQGRIHTSACSIAILPEAKEVDVKIENKDIRIDVFRSSGPGGQSVNTTDSAIRITHIKTGITVQCQDEKSQFKNKNKALKSLRAKLYHLKQNELNEQLAEKRRDMIKCGDRSDKIRTYNFPKDRCVDHRAGVESYNLIKLFSGNIDELILKIRKYFQIRSINKLNFFQNKIE